MLHDCKTPDLGGITIPEPEFGDMKLQVFPILHGKSVGLPGPFAMWENSVAEMLDKLPVQENARRAFVTIDSKWFSTPDRLRREGTGTFARTPTFATRGGTQCVVGGTFSDVGRSSCPKGPRGT